MEKEDIVPTIDEIGTGLYMVLHYSSFLRLSVDSYALEGQHQTSSDQAFNVDDFTANPIATAWFKGDTIIT
jgi:hypothetical protein